MTNQAPPLENWNLAASDPALMTMLDTQGGAAGHDEVLAWGERLGRPELVILADDANRHPPELRTHDRFGERLDEVVYHPAYHRLMELSVGAGLHGAVWADERPGSHVIRAAKFYLASQVEAGHGCPISMTHAIVPAMEVEPGVAADWVPGLTNREYDPAYAPAGEKAGLLAGMAMTERQGGSDVRANTTMASPSADGRWVIDGHKWFCSAPMSDAFLMLAQTDSGLSCFAVPRWRSDGTRNGLVLERLKDKLGNRSNASAEVRFVAAEGSLVGEEGRGVKTIIEMVNHTRLDCALGSAALMRQAVAQAAHHVQHRAAFGKPLVEQPLMRTLITDLALEVEAATMLALRLAGAFDRAGHDAHENLFRRAATPVAKFWITKRATPVIAEALECLGGNGYVEESVLPRLFRESPVNSIWEGSGNVIALDVQRALAKPEVRDAFHAECAEASGADSRLDRALSTLAELMPAADDERGARHLTEQMALVLQAALLVRHAPAPVAEAFLATRLGSSAPAVLGARPVAGEDDLIGRVSPA